MRKNNILNWMKLSSFIFALSSLFASCSNELDEVLQPAGNGNLQFVVSDFPAFGESPDTRAIGTQDVGKTAWEEGDKLLLSISFESGKKQGYTLEYLSGVWILNDKVLASSDITGVLALYAPDCEIKSDGSIGLASGKLYGMAEYIPAKTTVDGLNVSISFKDVTRTYSRLRLASEADQELTVTTTGFTPAGTTSVATDDYLLTTDNNGNAFLYGTFALGATVSVKADDGTALADYTFATEKHPEGIKANTSYALNARLIDLSPAVEGEEGLYLTANCYIVSEAGKYKFRATHKGNSNLEEHALTGIESVCVLWESFGTATAPNVGDLIKANLKYESGYIHFSTADVYREGNAVIAAKDESGNILWSWHIWLTDQPDEHVYPSEIVSGGSAGTMMDRNLGATSATPGEVGALGLLYQWGRKDPFLSSSSISSSILAESTITWPSAVYATVGTIDYTIANPTTFIYTRLELKNYDWYYTGSESVDNTRWTTSETAKSIYDPSPAGWRVPDGGFNGVWYNAGFGWVTDAYDDSKEGFLFDISSPSTTWYPLTGCRDYYDASLYQVSKYGYFWTASPGDEHRVYCLYLNPSASGYPVNTMYDKGRASGLAIRCVKE